MQSWFAGFTWITEVIEKLLSKPPLTFQRQFCSLASRAISWDYWKVCYSKEKNIIHMQRSFSWIYICLSVVPYNQCRDWLYNISKLWCRTNSTVKTSLKPHNMQQKKDNNYKTKQKNKRAHNIWTWILVHFDCADCRLTWPDILSFHLTVPQLFTNAQVGFVWSGVIRLSQLFALTMT